MALTFHFYLILFIFTNSSVGYAYTILEKYIPLISDVHSSHGTSSVFFTWSNLNQNMQENMFLQMLSREFSRKAVLTLVINFDMLEERIRMWRDRVSRALVVVMLTTPDEVKDFIINIRDIKISNQLWLLIFIDDFGEPMCEYCNKPIENIFNLRFDTEMLVACCQDPVIKEWWALDENKTKVANYTKWTEKEGLTFLTPKGLYERRHDVNGTGLRIAFVENPSYPVYFGKRKVGGFLYHVFEEIQRALNFDIRRTIGSSGFGIWNSTTRKWSGAMSQVVEGNADIGIGEFTITNRRLNAVDFSFPLIVTRTKLYIKEPDGLGVQWSAYFEAFAGEVWMTIIIIVIGTAILLTLVKMKGGCESLPFLLFENSIHVWGIFCQQGLSKFPAETSLRIAYFSIFVSALVVSSSYAASFISFLTVSTVSLPFSTVEGFAEDGTYKLIVLENSADYELFTDSIDPVWVKMNKLLKPPYQLPSTLTEAFKQVCKERVAFYTNEAVVQTMNIPMPCRTIRIDTERIASLAIILSRESQYTGVVNYHIQRFRDNGMMNRMKKKYFIKRNSLATTSHPVVTVWGVAPIFSFLLCGMIFALVILFSEKLCQSCINWAQKFHKARLRRMKIQKWFNVFEKQRKPQTNLRSTLESKTHRINNPPPRYHAWNIH